jgi:hypothetical protein
MIPTLLAALLAAAPASKLGPFVWAPFDNDAAVVLDACPAVAVFVVPNPATGSALVARRNACPRTTSVLRVTVSVQYDTTSRLPETAADDFWGRMQGSLGGIEPQTVDWLEGPHETDQIPWTRDLTAAQWYASFWSRLSDSMHAAQFNPLVGSIAVGTPALDGDLGQGSTNLFKPIAEAMKKKSYPWGWSYHAYSAGLSQSASVEKNTSLRYRIIRDECALGGVPLILGEVGQGPVGWLSHQPPTSSSAYLAWLKWFDGQVQQDPEVEGAALFQFGDTVTYKSFDLAALASDVSLWIATASLPDAGTSDAGTSDGGAAGSDAGGSGGSSSTVPVVGSGYVPPAHGCSCSGADAACLPLVGLLALALRGRRR